jgi:hypothetical protein
MLDGFSQSPPVLQALLAALQVAHDGGRRVARFLLPNDRTASLRRNARLPDDEGPRRRGQLERYASDVTNLFRSSLQRI